MENRSTLLRVTALYLTHPELATHLFRSSHKRVDRSGNVGENGRRLASGHSKRLLRCRPGPSCSVRTSFTKKVREHKPTEPAPTQHAAADQQANKSTLVAALVLLLLVDVVVVLLLLVSLAQEIGKE